MKIDYVEMPALDFGAMKAFYGAAFGWDFEEWGDEYMSFSNSGLEGGFRKADTSPPRGGSLVILLAEDLDAAEKAVTAAGGDIIERHEFPGGRRFHFTDPSGNELAIWTKT
ncbi:VOC family protein [Pelagibius sp. Alg239-R121]|uniref:VOC family protein n=1 Tax=Pelagibius sp. Alg239-R121 TaxID=2993448 RepID=UPI0024A66BDA|nr:VOC family protein [Pelagibius sp. Alg239-R121]